MRRLAALAAAVLVAALGASAARADGDPASDFLIAQKLFLPYDAKIPKPQEQALVAAVQSANTQGFKIRVALISSDYDLGSVTSLWRKPQTYARFLGVELSYYYKGRLLVAMPNGLGFNWPKHDAAPAYRLLAGVKVGTGPAGLAAAATEALRKLAAASGVTVSTRATGQAKAGSASSSSSQDRVVIVVAVLAALALGGAARIVLRRRRV